jgi:hypothetical protein
MCIQYVWADFGYGPTEYLAYLALEHRTLNPLLVLVLIGFAFSHYWWLIGYCLCLSFPFSIRWHNVSDTTITFIFMFLFLLKILYPYPRIGVY